MIVAEAREAGSATLQAAIVMGTVLFLFLGIIQYVHWQQGTHVAIAAANEGNRYARFVDGSDQDGKVVAEDFLGQAPSSVWGAEVVAHRDMGGPLPTATVEIRGSAFPVIRWLHLPIQASSTGPVEHVRQPRTGP